MKYTVSLLNRIDFSPADEVTEILQNIRTIITTVIGSVPLDRDFGISWDHLDMPLPVAQTLMRTAIIDAIREFEPRATIVSIEFDENTDDAMDGIMKPKVIVSIGEDEEEEI